MSQSTTTEARVPTTGAGTIRLTTAQAITRYLAAQHSVRDGRRQRLIPAMFGYLWPRQRGRDGAGAG